MQTHLPQATTRPFLRYAGGKQRLLESIRPHLPAGKRLVEPFVGAGSIFLGTDYPSQLLGDANLDLIAVWTAIKERPTEFIAAAANFYTEANRSEASYRRIRDEYNGSVDSFERAIRFLYLNRFGFNGLYRVNRQGLFNVPYGKPARLAAFPYDLVAAASERLRTATLLAGGFLGTMQAAGDGDVIYCDPPYSDLDNQRSFTAYTAAGFGRSDHVTLTAAALDAASRGATVVISNHQSVFAASLYKAFELVTLTTARSVAAAADRRGPVVEILAIARPGLSSQRTSWLD